MKQKSKTVAADAKKLKIEAIVSFIKKSLVSVFSIKSSVCHSEDSLLFEILVCCKDFFLITEREYLYIAVYLLNHKTEDEIINYTKKASKIEKDFYALYPELQFKFKSTMTYIDYIKFYTFVASQNRVSTDSCIFLNRKGKCDIYPVRPLVCRTYGNFLFSNTGYCHHKPDKYLNLPKELEEEYSLYDVYDKKIVRTRYPIFEWFADVFELQRRTGFIDASFDLTERDFAIFTLMPNKRDLHTP